MKTKKRALVFGLATILVVGMMSSCSGSKKNSSSTTSAIPYEKLVISEEVQNKMEQESGTIRMLAPGLNPSNENHQIVRAAKRFEEETGKKVEFVIAEYDTADWHAKLQASIAAKAPFDVLHATNSDFPLMAIKEYTQPIDKYVPLNKESMNIYAMDTFFTYNGKYHAAIPLANCNAYMMFYNKSIISDKGMDDPMELYESGQWTYEKMREMSIEATEDTNNDGVNDIWGMTTLYPSAFLSMNKTSAVKLNDDNKFALNLDDPALTKALEIVQDAYFTQGYCGGGNGDAVNAFMAGTHLFLLDVDWAIGTFLTAEQTKPMGFEWGWVPIPYGPDNTEKTNTTTSNGFSVIQGSKNPYSAGVLIQYILDEGTKNYGGSTIVIPEEFTKLSETLIKNPFYSLYYDSIINGASDLLGSVSGGGNIAKAIEELRPKYEVKVNEANSQMTLPEPVSLPTVTLDFEEDINAVAKFSPQAKISQATGAEALSGNGSLKVEMNAEARQQVDAFYTNVAVAPIAGYNEYKISFDYLVNQLPDGASYYFMVFDSNTEQAYTQVSFVPTKTGEKATAELTLFAASADSAELSLLFGGAKGAQTIILDNLKIEQVR